MLAGIVGILSAVHEDPYFNLVKLLLHMNGVNNGTTFTDSSLSPLSVTAVNTITSTAQYKWNGSSGLFNGSSSYLTASNPKLIVTSEDFCLEMWVYLNTATGIDTLYTTRATFGADPGIWFILSNGIPFFTVWGPSAGTELISLAGTSAIPAGQWGHVAMTRSGNIWRIFINGILSNSTTKSGSIAGSATANIGRDPSTAGRNFDGYMQDLRLTVGTARYTTNFTPPTSLFPNF